MATKWIKPNNVEVRFSGLSNPIGGTSTFISLYQQSLLPLNMRIPITTLVIAAALILGGCATLPADAPQYSRATAAPEGYATVYFYRVGAPPKLRTPTVLLDNKKISEPPELAYTWVYVKAGTRKFRVEWLRDTGWPAVEFMGGVSGGASYYYKITGTFEAQGLTHILGSSTRLIPSPIAEAELRDCCKYIKPLIQVVE
jgi:hypothetical protein